MSATRELGELTQRFVDVVPLGHRWTHRVAAITLGVFAAVCLAATFTRLSALPLIPLPAVAVAGFAHYRARRAGDDRGLLFWSGAMVGAALIALYLISIVGRMFE